MKEYVIASKPHDGAPEVWGPFTLDEAKQLLQDAAKKHGGQYQNTSGYWSDLPCWDGPDDETCFVVRKITNDFLETAWQDYDDDYEEDDDDNIV